MNEPIEVRVFKWPRRATTIARVRYLGEDEFGQWIGATGEDSWRHADRSTEHKFKAPLVKLIPSNTYWTACFHPAEPLVDVDIVLPATWTGNVLEEVDLELDILRMNDGRVTVRDQDLFEKVRATYNMPNHVAEQAQATCRELQTLVEQPIEPFATVGQQWLAHLMESTNGSLPYHHD